MGPAALFPILVIPTRHLQLAEHHAQPWLGPHLSVVSWLDVHHVQHLQSPLAAQTLLLAPRSMKYDPPDGVYFYRIFPFFRACGNPQSMSKQLKTIITLSTSSQFQ